MTSASDAFVVAARKSLSFLEVDHGFTLTETLAPPGILCNRLYQVTYRKTLSRSEELFVCLSTAPVRLEQDFEFGRSWPPEYRNTINVFELLSIESPDSRVEFTSGVYEAFGDVQQMSNQYATLAGVLRNHGARFFANDQSLWDAVGQLRESRMEQSEREETSRMAETAFKENEWQRAIELLESLGRHRTHLQSRRLAYAHKRIAQ